MSPSFRDSIASLRPALLRIARLQLRNDGWAEDVASDTLIAALAGERDFAGQSQLKTWVVGILKHKIVDQFRRNAREVSVEARMEETEAETFDDAFRADGHFAQFPLPAWDEPEEALNQAQFIAVVQEGLAQLPASLARIFALREIEGLETEEICKELGITTTNAHVMLYRARMRLREHLERHWFAPGRHARTPAHAASELQTSASADRRVDGSRA
ncbi:MAG: sigma-70 family RNA polymerase sigma factor [Burkholderiales bacterium]|jgi:RNA polymerase sigma-70 factor (ECF subfamily)|nr:sigma-70 family RNA polymerase sigma factor [Burkholderiales bacterium]